MTLADCTRFANENPVCYIATADGDQPRVRAFMMWFADETGFYFHCGSPKAVYKQLQKNPRVEVCYFVPGSAPQDSKMMRVSGEVEILDDAALKTKLLEERPMLKAMGVTGPDDPILAVFRITRGEAYFWTMADNMHESEVERVRF